MNIRVDLNTPIKDGTEVVFRSPVDCSQITGLIVYVTENGNTTSQEFALADAHGNNVGDIDHLFAENVVVKVILDVAHSMAFVQNADTNAYLEGRFADIFDKLCPTVIETGKLVQITSIEGMPLSVTGAFEGTLEVSVCGKNLYNKTAYPLDTNGYPYSNTSASGTFAPSQNYRRTGFIPVAHLAGQTIVLSHCPYATNPGMSFYTRIPDVGNSDDCKDAWCGGTTKESMIVPDNANYMVFCVKADDKDADVQIELGSVSTSYEPYVFTSGGAADDGEMPVIINALKGVNTIWAIDENGTDMPTNITVTGKADPVALIDKLMKTVFPATISNEEV